MNRYAAARACWSLFQDFTHQVPLPGSDLSVNQSVTTVAALQVFEVPASEQFDISNIRKGYIVSPGYPGNYPDGADGSIEIKTPTAGVSIPHQLTYLSINKSLVLTYIECYSFLPGLHSLLNIWICNKMNCIFAMTT